MKNNVIPCVNGVKMVYKPKHQIAKTLENQGKIEGE